MSLGAFPKHEIDAMVINDTEILMYEIREGRPKSIVPETIDAVHQLILQAHHM